MTAAFESPRRDLPCGKRVGCLPAAGDNSAARPAGLPTPLDNREAVVSTADWQTMAAQGTQIEFGNAGDHALVHQLLRAVHQAPSQEAFLSLLDEPSYQATDRLLVKQQGHVLSHVQLTRRMAWFAGNRLPVGGMLHLVTLPEYRGTGLSGRLLSAADEVMGEDGAVLSIIRSTDPTYFERCGWIRVAGQQFSEANTRDILSHLESRPVRRGEPRKPKVRTWRHVEFDALRQVYRQAVCEGWGSIDRSEAYWQWLVGRKSHDQILVALHPDRRTDGVEGDGILGYAVVSGPRIVELEYLDGGEKAAAELLERVCRDAIERDHHSIAVHLPANHPLHQVVITAGGSWVADPHALGGTLLVKMLNAKKWIQHQEDELLDRVKSAGLPRPQAIVFGVGQREYRLAWTSRRVKLVEQQASGADVVCDPCWFGRLLLGNLDLDDDACVSTAQWYKSEIELRRWLRALFPPRQFWQSPFDLLNL